MRRKILLNKNKSKESVNETNIIPIEINRDVSLLHDEVKIETIDTIKVYNNEKDKSTKHRFIFTIYPFCSNSIFNYLTEIVHKEGSPNCINFPNTGNAIGKEYTSISGINRNRVNCIRNTEYSNDKFKCTYHCGLDIFNNHLFRGKEEVSVQKRGSTKKCNVYSDNLNTYLHDIDSFNTLGDYVRNHNGGYVEIHAPIPSENFLYKMYYFNQKENKKYLPLYMYDTVKTFEESYNDNIERKDGWIGFKNPITLSIPVDTNYYVNKVMNNKEGGEFIDLCPERDLFYFTPKKNYYRDRIENNWDYCLTYPYESVYSGGNILTGENKGLPLFKFENNSYYNEHLSSGGLDILTLRSIVKHNLNIGDYVNLIFSNNEKIKCRVVNIDESTNETRDRYFSILKSDIEPYINNGSYPTRFLKVVQGYECEYYFRKFKKIEVNNNILKSEINKVAFANTIYGDEVSQIIYTDTFDCDEYRDNRGRPLTEIYLTIIKTNKGYEDWYNNGIYSGSTIEYSHVFGKVSSGLDLPPYTITDRNLPIIRKFHNITGTTLGSGSNKVYIPERSTSIENNITISENEFYGDLVEFNIITQNETVLEKVMYRFNTAQREVMNNELYKNLYYDEMGMDLYDRNYDDDPNKGLTNIIRKTMNNGYANLNPEGYVYQPHYKIQIGDFKDDINEGFNILMDVSDVKYEYNVNNIITFNTSIFYSLVKGDKITLIHKTTYNKYEFTVTDYKYNNEKNVYECKMNGKNGLDLTNYLFFKHNNDIPEYAYLLPNDTGKCLWRNILPPSEYTFMDKLYNIPFTNGAFYHHTNINFYVKRQDPFQKYGLFLKNDSGESVEIYRTPVSEIDLSNDDFIIESNSSTCF